MYETWSDPDAEPLEWFDSISSREWSTSDQAIDPDIAERLYVRGLMLQWVRENYPRYRAAKKSEERDWKNGQRTMF